MSQGPLCPNLSQKVHAEVSQMANHNLSRVILLGGLSVNLNYLKTRMLISIVSRPFLDDINNSIIECNMMKCTQEILAGGGWGSNMSSQICIDLKYHLTQV